MSKKGKMAIEIPSGVSVEFSDRKVVVKGPRGTLERVVSDGIDIVIENNSVSVIQNLEDGKAMHGTERALINNMVIGVHEGFSKKIKMVGTGYKVFHEGNVLDFKLMKSHPVKFPIPEGIDVKVEGTTIMYVSGNDRQQVGQVAHNISSQRKKDPYKGKGIHIEGEFIRRKAGKSKKK